jgi:two-component system, OmpR family, KDP operon response regulator KdpE
LIVEDEPAMRSVLRMMLAREGYELVEADTGARAEFEARRCRPDLVLMDLGLPDIDGLTVIRHVREWSPLPIIIVSARAMDDQMIAAFDAGADDYITKPFSMAELLARVRAGLRRSARGDDYDSILNLGPLRVDLARRLSHGPQGDVHLTPLEYRAIECLARRAGMVVRQRELVREIWGPDRRDDVSILHAFIRHLRQKLEPDPSRPRYLVTEIGVGYRLCADEATQLKGPGEEGANFERVP